MKIQKLILILTAITLLVQSCSLVKKIAGADINAEQFESARLAKYYEQKAKSSAKLAQRLKSGEPLENSDFSFCLSKQLLTKVINQYIGTKGKMDDKNSFEINNLSIQLENGSGLCNVSLKAHNSQFNVDVDLLMDCILVFEIINNELIVVIEPFNISPDVKASGILSSTEEIIGNLIKINLAEMKSKFPPLKLPLDFTNKFIVPKTEINIKDKLNMKILSPDRVINYNLKLKEVLIFKDIAYISLNLDKIEVK